MTNIDTIQSLNRLSTASPANRKALVFLGLALIWTNVTSAAEINFSNFANIADQSQFMTNGSAGFVGDVLRLTPNTQGQAGSAFLNQGQFIQSTSDFSSEFQFKIHSDQPTNLRSDGLAFLIQNYGPNYLGAGGGDLGYMNGPALSASQYVYAIEFDIHQGSGDLSDNEIAVTELSVGGKLTIASINLNTLGIPLLLDDGSIKNVKIEYGFHGQDYLSIFISEGTTVPQLVLQTLLPSGHELFRSGGASTYLGFSAGTGGGYANHDILNWRVNIPEPGTLSLLVITGLALRMVKGRVN